MDPRLISLEERMMLSRQHQKVEFIRLIESGKEIVDQRLGHLRREVERLERWLKRIKEAKSRYKYPRVQNRNRPLFMERKKTLLKTLELKHKRVLDQAHLRGAAGMVLEAKVD